jgi:hypothetical protein
MIKYSISQHFSASCDREWYNRYRLNLKPVKTGIGINLGSALHRMVAAYWLGKPPSDALAAWGEERLLELEGGASWVGEMEETLTHVIAAAPALFERWRMEFKPDQWEPVCVEKELERERGGVLFRSVVDFVGIYTRTREPHLLDWKFRDNIIQPNPFPLQMILYKWILASDPISRFWDDVRLTIFSVRTQSAEPPKINKGGTVSRVKIASTWAIYERVVKDQEQDPNDYAEMKTWFDSLVWSHEDSDYWSLTDCEKIVNNALGPRAVSLANRQNYASEYLPTALGTVRCRTCDFRARCLAEFLEGYSPMELEEEFEEMGE